MVQILDTPPKVQEKKDNLAFSFVIARESTKGRLLIVLGPSLAFCQTSPMLSLPTVFPTSSSIELGNPEKRLERPDVGRP